MVNLEAFWGKKFPISLYHLHLPQKAQKFIPKTSNDFRPNESSESARYLQQIQIEWIHLGTGLIVWSAEREREIIILFSNTKAAKYRE